MDKLSSLKRYFPHFLIFSYLIRLLICGASLGDALVVLVFGALYAGHEYLDHIREPEANKELKNQIKSLQESQELLKNKVGSVTIAGTFARK